MGRKEFAAAVLDLEYETYVVHIDSVSSVVLPSSSPLELNVNSSYRPQISGLIVKEATTKISAKYLDFADIFSPNLAFKLPEYTGINDHAIKLVDCQQPPYRRIYSLGPIELGILKAYIKTNLANEFIRPSKSPTSVPILFDQKSDSFFRLCVDYQCLNNPTVKNRYPFPQIRDLLNMLERAR